MNDKVIASIFALALVASAGCHREQPTRASSAHGVVDTPQCEGYRFAAIQSGQLATLVVRTSTTRPRVVELHFDAGLGWRLHSASRGRLGVQAGVAHPSLEGACFDLKGATDACLASAPAGRVCALW